MGGMEEVAASWPPLTSCPAMLFCIQPGCAWPSANLRLQAWEVGRHSAQSHSYPSIADRLPEEACCWQNL